MIETKGSSEKSVDLGYYDSAPIASVWLAYAGDWWYSALKFGRDVFNDARLPGIGLVVKPPRVACLNVGHDCPATNSESMRIAAIDKSTPVNA